MTNRKLILLWAHNCLRILESNKLLIRQLICMKSERALHSHFHSIFLMCCLCLFAWVYWKQHSSSFSPVCWGFTVVSAGWVLYVLSLNCVLFLRLHYFTVRGVKAEARARGSSELILLSWLIVTQQHPAATVTETACNFSRHHRPERCFNQKLLSNGLSQCSYRCHRAGEGEKKLWNLNFIFFLLGIRAKDDQWRKVCKQ